MKPHSLYRAVAALLLAGGLAAAQAQQSPPTGQPMPPSAAPSGGVGAVDEDEARAIMAARERCGQEAGAQAQQDCMNRAQQDYYRTRPGGAGAGGGSMQAPGSASPDAGTGVMPPGRSPGSTGSPGTPNAR